MHDEQFFGFDHCNQISDSLQEETLPQLINNSELSYSYNSNNSCCSGYSSYDGSPSSLPSQGLMLQRSVSSHSLQKNETQHQHQHHPFSALFAELFNSEDGPVRRVYSTGDLQGINGMQQNNHWSESPLSTESIMIIEGMSRACRYSLEEKVRIEV